MSEKKPNYHLKMLDAKIKYFLDNPEIQTWELLGLLKELADVPHLYEDSEINNSFENKDIKNLVDIFISRITSKIEQENPVTENE